MSALTLQCPVCETRTLNPFTWNGISVDVCPSCHGVWFDAQEMKAVADSDTVTNIDRAFQGEYREGNVNEALADRERRCPLDGEPMERHEWRGDTKIVMDWCRQCQGTWLDAGELEGYAAHLKDLEENPPELSPEQWAEIERIRANTDAEIRQFVDGIDYGYLNPIFKTVARVQRMLGVY